MRALIEALADTRPAPWDTVIMVGAGSGSWLPLLRRLEAGRLVLIEPQAELATLLGRMLDEARDEQVRSVALTGSDAVDATLHVCSNSRLTGLAPPARLMELLPNLQLEGRVQVDATSLDRLARELKLDHRKRNLLILEAPGQLSAVRSATGLSHFCDIVLHAGSEPLYEGDPTRDQLHALLAEAGFESWAVDPDSIYPFDRRGFRRNDSLLELARVRHATEANLKAARIQVEAAEGRVAKLEGDLESMSSQLASARGREKQSSDSIATLQAGLQQARIAIKAQKERAASLTGQLGERDAEIASLKEREKQISGEANQLQEKHARIERELRSVTAERDSEAKKNEQGNEQLERLKRRLDELDDQLINARDAMALAIRMQTLRENDLNEIRERYAQLQGEFQTQRELLKKLSERLVAANEYFQQLAGNNIPQNGFVTLQANASLSDDSVNPHQNDEPRKRARERKGKRG